MEEIYQSNGEKKREIPKYEVYIQCMAGSAYTYLGRKKISFNFLLLVTRFKTETLWSHGIGIEVRGGIDSPHLLIISITTSQS